MLTPRPNGGRSEQRHPQALQVPQCGRQGQVKGQGELKGTSLLVLVIIVKKIKLALRISN